MPIPLSAYPYHMRDAVRAEARIREKVVALIEASPERMHESAAYRMAIIDSYPKAIRELIHTYGRKLIEVRLVKFRYNSSAIERDILQVRADRDRKELRLELEEMELDF